ncbi:Cof-type HAD-IIB family hydrolase, partial [Bifidobacterium pseudocatenulatum]|nr:Cof-type HAD-IIB family hydrolase [Bifidobacterium pseudocatenulatum]
IPFILASARSPKGMIPITEELNITDNPIICYNGALVLKKQKSGHYTSLFSHELNRTDVQQLINLINTKFPHVTINLYSGSEWYVDKIDKWTKIEADITKEHPIVKNIQQLLLNVALPIHKLLLIGASEEIKQLLGYCTNLRLPNSSFYLSKDNYLEITHRDVSKDKALIELSKYYDVPLENTMAIGDNFNDIPMLSLAGLGVVMDNAPEEVKKSTNLKTTDNNHNGVSKAIRKFILDT